MRRFQFAIIYLESNITSFTRFIHGNSKNDLILNGFELFMIQVQAHSFEFSYMAIKFIIQRLSEKNDFRLETHLK